MSREKDEFQQALDILIDLELACGDAHLPESWYAPRIDRAHVLIRDKRKYRELKAILVEILDALHAIEKRKKN